MTVTSSSYLPQDLQPKPFQTVLERKLTIQLKKLLQGMVLMTSHNPHCADTKGMALCSKACCHFLLIKTLASMWPLIPGPIQCFPSPPGLCPPVLSDHMTTFPPSLSRLRWSKMQSRMFVSLTKHTQDDYNSGLLCPWDNEDLSWEYRTGEGNGDFTVDDTITVQCTDK